LSTLTSSLQTLTVERAKNEASFQKDKKSMLAQQDGMARQHAALKKQLEDDLAKFRSALQESQASLRAERLSREEEQATHADMLKELQSLIASERDSKEALGLQIQELEREMLTLRSQLHEHRTERDREMDEVTQSLTLHVTNLQAELQLAEKRSAQPPAELVQLQREMQRLKGEHAKSLLLEQQRASDAEERLKQQTTRQEQQVASFEMKISQLSETVGSYVLLRDQEQMNIQKLKERISQLDLENTQLTKEHVERQEARTQTAGQVTALQEKIARLKAFLKIATSRITEKTAIPANLEGNQHRRGW
jgi:chromosome segregation ATPase